MALIIVGGQTKSVGKTTLVCNILNAFPNLQWVALKVTTHGHTPRDCRLHSEGLGWFLWEQTRIGTDTDSARFLAAGARRSFLLECKPNSIGDACSGLVKELPLSASLIIESTAAAEYLNPDLFLIVSNSMRQDVKHSAREQLVRADVVLYNGEKAEVPVDVKDYIANKLVCKAMPDRLDSRIRSMLTTILGTSS
jgi:hypothetical protein